MPTHTRLLVTSALPYANGPLHIGHLAGAYLPADVFVRYQRLMGREVLFVCGSDEHGAAITMRAMKEGITPQEIIDKYHRQFEVTFKQMGIHFDIYHRTSATLHHQTSQDFFRTLYNNNQFTELVSAQFYDPEKEQFLADRYIMGTCPSCGNPDAYGDQCEKCGSTLNPTDLINPRSTLSGAQPVLKETRHWYLPLDQHEGWLRAYVEQGVLDGVLHHDPAEWKNHVVGQCKSWLDQGLQPRAMTRDLDWGIDVPHDIEGHEGKKLYVWMDAPIGYISATKQWCLDNQQEWTRWWQDPDTALIHFIGKDNIVFHCLTFPAMLKAHGDFILPYNVPANQFMNLEGQKISTSRNWAVWVHEYVNEHPDRIDELRYYLIKNMPEQRDSEFTWKGFQETCNADLVNNIANFVNRVMVLTDKFYQGVVPADDPEMPFISPESPDQTANMLRIFDLLNSMVHETAAAIESYELRQALHVATQISTLGNQLIQFNEPWKQIKTEPETVAQVMFAALQIVATLSVVMSPFIPNSAHKIRELLGLPPVQASPAPWQQLIDRLAQKQPLVPAGSRLAAPTHLFTRITDEWIDAEIAKLQAMSRRQDASPTQPAAETAAFTPIADTIVYDDFAKLDLRIGTITAAEAVPKADKLLKLTIDLGFETRTVVSGIAAHYKPDDIIGQQVVLVANLAPRKLKGIESQGMILMAADLNGKLCFVQPSETKWPNGSRVS